MLFYFGECAHAAAHVNAMASVWFYCVNNIPSDRSLRLYGSAAAQRPHSSRVLTWVVKIGQFLSSNELDKLNIGLSSSFRRFLNLFFFTMNDECGISPEK